MPHPEVAVVAFDGISPFHLSVPCAVFGEHLGQSLFELKVCAMEPGPIRTTAGFALQVEGSLEVLETAQTVIVPSWRDPAERPPQALLAALVQAEQRGAHIVGLCLGAYVLAEAGVLQGRRATTHWAYARDFAQRYPGIEVDPDVLYVQDGPVVTSAGTAAGIDCCLHLLRQHHGSEVANSVARRLVVPPHRQGGQAQFIEQPMPAHPRSSVLAGLLDEVRGSLQQVHTVDSLAARALMSRRTFTRQFRQTTGMTVGEWLHAQRLSLAQRLLETTDHPIAAIAELGGFGSPESLRLHFRRALGVSPQSWRKTFQG